jgi:1-acyl-sn-glycerol-3-phosphate acyltransferase
VTASTVGDPAHLEWPRTDDTPYPSMQLVGIARRLGRIVFRRWDAHVSGAELVPREGPVLLASNHTGIMDGPLLFTFAPRVVHAMMKQEMYAGRREWAMLALGTIPVQREVFDPRAVKLCLRVLREDGVVAIYPEGGRGAGDMQHNRLGLAYLATVTGAPIVPVASLGTRHAGQAIGALVPRGSRLDLVFGAPFTVPKRPWPRRRSEMAELAESLRVRLAEHVARARASTNQIMPGPAPDELRDAADRDGPEVGPQATEGAA